MEATPGFEPGIRVLQTRALATWLCRHILSCRKTFVNKYYAIVYENITKTFGAGNGAQTRDLCLGKAALYQLSYSRTKLRAKL